MTVTAGLLLTPDTIHPLKAFALGSNHSSAAAEEPENLDSRPIPKSSDSSQSPPSSSPKTEKDNDTIMTKWITCMEAPNFSLQRLHTSAHRLLGM